ncbi:MAG TPA: S1 RNA-binding domain-containing protein [Pseudomonadota bacterium]|nr:S1 RNA-binding domain-containing protein [Pseudomonadota bacterium]
MSSAKKTTSDTAASSEFAAMLAEFEREQKVVPSRRKQEGHKVGTEVKGRILSIGRDSAFVDLGGKDDGAISLEELRGPDGQLTVRVGDEITARIVEIDGRGGGVVLRRTLGRGPDARAELHQAFELSIPIEGQVSAVIKGGVEVQVAGVRGFCPISQLDLRHVDDASGYVGQRLLFRITRLEETGRLLNVVLSRRTLLEEAAQAQAEELRKKLAPGVVVRGRVTALKDYGAFVDIGGIEAMLHVSELSFQRARHPKEMLSVGQEVEVLILKIEPGTDKKRGERISLSLKSLEKDPWSDIETQFPIGMRFPAKVLRTEAFGAIVELAPGIEGLVHISELGGGRRLRHAKDAVQSGGNIDVVVQQIDREKRRLSLSVADPADVEGGDLGSSAPQTSRMGFGTLGDLLSKTAHKKA